MTTAMFDAREAMIPGGAYDRSGMMNGGGKNMQMLSVIVITIYIFVS